MDHVIAEAKKRLLEIEAEGVELRQFLRIYERLAQKVSCEPKETVAPSVMLPREELSSGSSVDGPVSSREEIIEAARSVLKANAPAPTDIAVLYDSIVAQGLEVGGLNPKGNLSAKLSKPDDIVFVRNEGWYYRPQMNEDADTNLGRETSAPSIFETHAKGREAGPGGGP